jgi:ubiquinone/menaquinone biosynthesis C-methylase UbiE
MTSIAQRLRRFGRSLVEPLLAARLKRMTALIGAYIRDGDTVLDVGCGRLEIGEVLAKEKGAHWIGVDTVDYHEAPLEFHRYDGKRLPFDDGAADVVLLSFVLHHCDEPEDLVREIFRVTRHRIVVLEDVVDGTAGSFRMAKVHDYIANRLIDSNIPLPYQFKTPAEWERLFQSVGLRVLETRPIKSQPLAWTKQVLFSLEKGI